MAPVKTYKTTWLKIQQAVRSRFRSVLGNPLHVSSNTCVLCLDNVTAHPTPKSVGARGKCAEQEFTCLKHLNP